MALHKQSTLKFKRNKLLLKKIEQIKTRTIIALLLMIFVCFSCEKKQTEQETTFFDLQGENGFVGNVDGTNALVSILLGEEEGIVYICNGDEAISEWFSGPISDVKKIHFSNSQGTKIIASLTGDSFIGEVSFSDGRKFSFKAEANKEAYGGIYKVIDEKAVEAEIKAGWIVKNEENQRGSITFQSRVIPNITLSKKNFEDISDGTSNTLSINGSSFSFFRYKVKIPISPSPAPPIPIPYPFIGG